MPDLHVRISCSIKGAAKVEAHRTVSISEETLKRFFPHLPDGWGGWPRTHEKEAEKLVTSLVKEKFFPDELMPIEDLDDLRRMGVAALDVTFTAPGKQLDSKLLP